MQTKTKNKLHLIIVPMIGSLKFLIFSILFVLLSPLIIAIGNAQTTQIDQIFELIQVDDLNEIKAIDLKALDIDSLDSVKGSLVQFAIKQNKKDIVRYLIESGADVNAPTKGFRKKSNLHLAVEVGNPDLIKLLLDNGANTDAEDKLGQTPLHHAVLNENTSAINLLASQGAKFDSTFDLGATALLHAIRFSNKKVTDLAITLGAIVSTEELAVSQCSECHKLNGGTERDFAPHIGGQSAAYLQKQLGDFQQLRRNVDPKITRQDNTTMSSTVTALNDQMISALADFYAQLPPSNNTIELTNGDETIGEEIYRGSVDSSEPSCLSCHGSGWGEAVDAATPSIHRQNGQYIANQLTNFRSGFRANDKDSVMQKSASALTDDQIMHLAAYLSKK